MPAPAPIPINILTGFLGAGKTTLLNALVRQGLLADAVVLINEFGEIPLDHLLVEGVEGDMILLSSGCLCCSIRGELVSALEDLLRRRDNRRMRAFDRVVIETTGLADPAPILNTLMLHPYLSRRFVIDSIVTVVDAVNGAATLDAHKEARRQAAVADRLVLTKSDLADEEAVLVLTARLKRLNPTAPLLDAASACLEGASLLDAGLHAPRTQVPDVARWLNAQALDRSGHDHAHDVNRHDERIRAFCLTADKPLRAASIDLFLQLLRSIEAAKMLRLKGIVALIERPDEPMILHGVQHVVHEPVRLARWPDGDRSTRLVLIAEDLPEDEVRKLWAAISDAPEPDRPDRQALQDNPLRTPSGGLLG